MALWKYLPKVIRYKQVVSCLQITGKYVGLPAVGVGESFPNENEQNKRGMFHVRIQTV
jgi:hypothetical protein